MPLLPGVSCGRLVGANGGEGLGGIVAGRNGVIAYADGEVAAGDLLKGDILEGGVLLGDDDEFVGEHVGTRGLIHVAFLHCRIHGALGSGNLEVGIGASFEHFVELARCLVLRVGEGHACLLRVELLGFVHGLGKRVSCKDLQLHIRGPPTSSRSTAASREAQGGDKARGHHAACRTLASLLFLHEILLAVLHEQITVL